MNNSKVIGGFSSGEPWIGLVDGCYAIILTLLVIELPALIIEIIGLTNEHTAMGLALFAIFVDVLGYLFATILIFDMWSIHKGYLSICSATRFSSIGTMMILWLASLIPPAIYLVEHFSQKIILDEIHSESLLSNTMFETYLFRVSEISIILIIYLILNFLIKKEAVNFKRKDPKIRFELKEIKNILNFRIVIGLILFILSILIRGDKISSMPISFAIFPFGIYSIFTLIPYEWITKINNSLPSSGNN